MTSILIIEDEIVVAKGIEQALIHNGYKVLGIAKNYQQAMMLIRNSIPDIILCDIDLNEEKTGLDIIEELSAQVKIPVIYISACTDNKTLTKAFSLEPVTYLTKPYTETQLITTLKLAINNLQKSDKKTLTNISKKELEIIKLLSNGMTTKEIAEFKFRSYETINNHKRNIYKKLNIHNIAELITLSKEVGII